MKLRNCLQNLATINFSKFSKFYFSELNFSKVSFILEEQTWCGVNILDEIVFFSKSDY